MYAVYDKKRKRIIAFHKNKDIVFEYIRLSKIGNLKPVKIKDKYYKSLLDGNDYYLVETGERYVPRKYSDAVSVYMDDNYENEFILKRLNFLIENDESLSTKDVKAILRVKDILEKNIKEESTDTIDFDTLESLKDEFDSNYNYLHYGL